MPVFLFGEMSICPQPFVQNRESPSGNASILIERVLIDILLSHTTLVFAGRALTNTFLLLQ